MRVIEQQPVAGLSAAEREALTQALPRCARWSPPLTLCKTDDHVTCGAGYRRPALFR